MRRLLTVTGAASVLAMALGVGLTVPVAAFVNPVAVNVYLGYTEVGAAGKVTSNPAGIDCGTACTITVEAGTVVTLTAVTLNAQTSFVAWDHATCNEGQFTKTCSFTASAQVDIQATITAPPPTEPPPPTPTPSATTHPHVTPKPTARPTKVPATVPPTLAPTAIATAGVPSAPVGTEVAAPSVVSAPTPLPAGPTAGPSTTPTSDSSAGVAPILILAIAVLLVLGAGAYWRAKNRQPMAPPGP
jgi:hypothetical protein